MQRGYGGLLGAFVKLRWPLAVIYLVGCSAVIWMIGGQLGTEIFPKTDNGQFALRLRAPSGTRVSLTEELSKKVLAIIAREAGGDDKIEVSIGMVGVHNSSFPVNLVHLWNGGPEEGWLAVQLKPGTGIHIEPFKEKLRGVFARELPDVRFSFEPQDIVSRVMSFGSPTPVEIAISGSALPVSKAYADKIMERMKAIPFLRDVQIAQTLDYPSIAVNVDRERAGLLGVQMSKGL
jgi:multidrug efflux pump subunit AcrB